ncbi:hypothetical protein PO909_008508, partial [Leuciscus waleckii]
QKNPIKSSSKIEKESLYPFKDLKKTEDQQRRYLLEESDSSLTWSPDYSDVESETPAHVTKKNKKVRLAPVIVKNRRTEIEVDNEEEYEEEGERRTRIVKITKIYNLHPVDGVMIVNVNLSDNDQKRLTESVENRVGESQENIEAGWVALQTFLFELKPAEVNWARITSCMQKTGESVAEFEERFTQIWLEHAGLNDSEDLDKNTSMPLKTAFVNGLKPEVSKALKIQYDDWDSVGKSFNQIVEWSAKIERTHEVKLRALRSKTMSYHNKTMWNEHKENEDNRQSKTQRRCRYCNEEGHWHQLVTSHQTTDAKDDVLVEGAVIQAVKERGAHTAALRQLQQVLPCKLIQNEASRKQMQSVTA